MALRRVEGEGEAEARRGEGAGGRRGCWRGGGGGAWKQRPLVLLGQAAGNGAPAGRRQAAGRPQAPPAAAVAAEGRALRRSGAASALLQHMAC